MSVAPHPLSFAGYRLGPLLDAVLELNPRCLLLLLLLLLT